MKVLASEIIIRLTDVHSLKEKRSIRESLIRKVQNKFKISIAECDSQDDLDFLTIGFAAVSNSNTHLNSVNEKVIHFIETYYGLDIVSKETYWL
ncbi:DUF503 domain-containing protein [Ezakiella massiliensis]|uniref:DUF503 domain-containing protein n=1 Tax=Ezakiella massiliensis TaxID=1852374 RepID=UPI00094E7ED3|nr:DUF503 domain-containing protein [Ezakiella massiliensis]